MWSSNNIQVIDVFIRRFVFIRRKCILLKSQAKPRQAKEPNKKDVEFYTINKKYDEI